jgi:N utilization substance protein B
VSGDRPGRHLPRREARTRALELLFAADVRGADPAVVMADAGWVDDFTRLLVDTVGGHLVELDELIGAHAEGWAVDRMPAVDRTVLRLAVAEMLHVDDVPPKVAIDEAVELAKALSTDSSPGFVNGVLAAIAKANDLL